MIGSAARPSGKKNRLRLLDHDFDRNFASEPEHLFDRRQPLDERAHLIDVLNLRKRHDEILREIPARNERRQKNFERARRPLM